LVTPHRSITRRPACSVSATRAFGIFEGAEQIQQLVVARAISGLWIE
jgi:hypothetical protein